MAAPSKTYTLANSTTADATQVETNFNDVLGCMSSGLIDFSILTLVVASTCTLSGAVTLGSSSSNDLTVNASLASSIPIKTTFSYDIGTSTIGLRDIYLGSADSAARTTKIRGATVASSYTLTLPTTGGTSGYYLNTNGSGTLAYNSPFKYENYLLNSFFDFWQRGTSTTVANGATGYLADRWYANNILGTNGVITYSRQTGGVTGSTYGAKLLISTAPTASQANGCELYQTLDNYTSLRLYNQTCSFSCQVKAFGNVTSIGLQFYYKTTEAKVDTAIGSETTVTINSAGFTLCEMNSKALGTSMTTSGVVGVRIRIAGVSSGSTYDLNNGFQVEQCMWTIGDSAATPIRQFKDQENELAALQRYYEKSYNITVDPGSTTTVGEYFTFQYQATANGGALPVWVPFKVTKRIVPAVVSYSPGGSTADRARVGGATAVAVSTNTGLNGMSCFGLLNNNGGNVGTLGEQLELQWTADAEI